MDSMIFMVRFKYNKKLRAIAIPMNATNESQAKLNAVIDKFCVDEDVLTLYEKALLGK